MSKIVLTETRLREMIYESINNALNENAVDEGRAQALWKGAKAFVGPRQDGQTRWGAAKQAYGQEMYNTGQRLSNKYGKYNNNGVTDNYRGNTTDTGSVTQPPAEQSKEGTTPQDNKTPAGPYNSKTTSSTGGNVGYTGQSQTGVGNANQTKTAGNNQTGDTKQKQNAQIAIQSIVQGQEYQNLINLGEQALLDFKRNGQRYNYRTPEQSRFIMQAMQFLKNLGGGQQQ